MLSAADEMKQPFQEAAKTLMESRIVLASFSINSLCDKETKLLESHFLHEMDCLIGPCVVQRD